MKTNEIIVEGPIDFIKKVGAAAQGLGTGGIKGAITGYQGEKAAQASDKVQKEIVDRMFADWNAALRNYPQMAPADLNQLMANWAKDRFRDKPNLVLPAPSVARNNPRSMYDYLAASTKKYFQTVSTQAAPVAQPGTAGLKTGFNFPKTDADIQLPGGWNYEYDRASNQWRDEDSNLIVDPTHVTSLNKRYLEVKKDFLAGRGPDPDKPSASTMGLQPNTRVQTPQTQAPVNPAPVNPAPVNPAPVNPAPVNTTPVAPVTTPTTVGPAGFDDLPPPDPNRPSNVTNINSKKIPESRKQLKEGGNAIARSTPVKRQDVAGVVDLAKKALPAELLKNLHTDIGSAGYKVESGDIDVMIEAQDLVDLTDTHDAPDPVKKAKQVLKAHFEKQGIEANANGRNVSIGIEYREQDTNELKIAQVDVMVIHDVNVVAPWHQHGPRGMYDDPDFKASHLFILMNSIAKHLNLKFDAFAAKLLNRDTNEVVARTRKEVARVLFGPKAKETALDSVRSALKALESDPDRDSKLAQARQDAAKGIINLPETVQPGTAAWFRQISDVVR
jgi:hypothetical protein